MMKHIIRLASILKKDNAKKGYHDLCHNLIMVYTQAQNARVQNDVQEVYSCIVEMDFIFDILESKKFLDDDQFDRLVYFIAGSKYFLLKREPVTDEAMSFITYVGAKSTREQAMELQKNIQVAEEDIDYQKKEDDDARRPHIL
jgi:cell division protein FtsL